MKCRLAGRPVRGRTTKTTGSTLDGGDRAASGHRRWIVPLATLLLGVATEAWVLRGQIANDFTVLFSDNYDGVIETSILEHWFRVARGLESWNRPIFFAPYADTLGYNDGFLLFGIPYALLRSIGLDPFLARELAVAAIRICGFIMFAVLAHRAAAFPLPAAMVGAALFVLWNSMCLHDIHGQLMSLAFAPGVFHLLLSAARHLRSGRRDAALGRCALANLLLGGWLLTGFYMAWFFILFVCLLVLLTSPDWWPPLRQQARLDGRTAITVSAAVVIGLCACAPFLAVYLPVLRRTGGHAMSDVSLLPARALLHVGPGNVLYGWWLDHLAGRGLEGFGGDTVGITSIVLLAAVAGGLVRRRRHDDLPWGAMLAASLLFMVLPLDLAGWSPWRLVYRVVPGAGGLREIRRMMLFLDFPLSLLATRCIAIATQHRRAGGWLLAFSLLAEQINLQEPLGLQRRLELARVASARPPDRCRNFFVVSPPPAESGIPRRITDLNDGNVPAMLMSEMLGLPTINGFSTFNPPDWNFERTRGADYITRVTLYGSVHDMLRHLCEFDLARHAWSADPLTAPAFAALHARFETPPPTLAIGQGWGSDENGGRWTIGHAAQLELLLGVPARELSLTLRGTPLPWRGAPSPITLMSGDEVIARWDPRPGTQTLSATIPARLAVNGALRLRLLVEHPVSPAQLGNGHGDNRKLGFFANSLDVVAAH